MNKYNKISIIYFYILFAIAVLFSLHNSYNHPVSDAFYHIKTIIIPYHNNQLEFKDLFITRGQSDQPHILYKLFLILNYKIFNLDFRIELIVGLIGIYFCSLIIINSLSKSLNNKTILMSLFIQVIIITKLISFNTDQHFVWTLVTFDYCITFFALLSFYYIDKIIINSDVPYKFYFFVPLTIIFGSTTGEFSILIAIIIFVIFGLIIKKKKLFLIATITFVIFISTILFIFFLKPISNQAVLNNTNTVFSIDALKFILYSLGQGLISVETFKNKFNINYHNISLVLGFIVFLVNIYVLFIYFKNKLYLTTTYPLLLLLLSYALLFGMLWARFRYFGAEYAFQPRYVRLMEFNIISLLWISGLNYLKWHTTILKHLFLIIGSLIIFTHILFIPARFETSKWIIKYHKNEEKEVRMLADSEIEKVKMPRIDVYGAKEVSKFLKENNLSLFDGEFK